MLKTAKSKQLAIAIIVFLCVLSQFAVDCYLPSLPAIAKSLHVANSSAQLSITLFFLGAIPIQFISGTLSDTFGRRPLYIIGVIVFILGSIACLFAKNIDLFLFGRFIQGFGIGSGFVLAWASARDMFSGKEFTIFISIIAALTILIPVISPIAGGYIQHYLGWRYVFALLLTMGLILFTAMFTFFPETLQDENKQSLHVFNIFKTYKSILTNRAFLTNGLSVPFATASAIVYITITPFLYQHVLHLTPLVFSWVTALIAVGIATSCIINSKLVEGFGEEKLIITGIGCMLLGSLLLLIFALLNILNLYVVLLPMLIITLGIGFIAPNASSRAMSPFNTKAGSAAAIFSGLQMLIFSGSSAIATLFHTENQKPLALLLIIFPLIVIILFQQSGCGGRGCGGRIRTT